MLGDRQEEISNSTTEWLNRIYPEDQAKVEAAIAAHLAGLTPQFESEYRIMQQDSTYRWILSRGQAIRDIDGNVVRMYSSETDITKSKQIEAEIRNITIALENAVEGIAQLDTEGRYIAVNKAYAQMVGYPQAEMIGISWQVTVHPSDIDHVMSAFEQMLFQGKGEAEIRGIRKDGSIFFKQIVLVKALETEQNNGVKHYCFMKDISERKRVEAALKKAQEDLENQIQKRTAELQAVNSQLLTEIAERKRIEAVLRQSEERYALAVRGTNDGLWDWDLTTNEIYYSRRWKSILGYFENQISNSVEEWFSRIHPSETQWVKAEINAHLQGLTPHFESEHRLLHKDGTYRWVLCRAFAVRDDDGKACRIAGSQTDITTRKLSEEQLRYKAFYDQLTNLPNRALFLERLGHTLALAQRWEDYLFAVLFLDLDRFKIVNDSLGHLAGDQLLKAIARRLESCLRPGDTVARLGGDEFAVLLEDIKDINTATRIANRILQELILPIIVEGHEVFTTASIGIVIGGTYNSAAILSHHQPENFLRDADIAMYRAKAQGKARYEIFNPDMHSQALALLRMETDLRKAIERQEFELYYQPIVSLETGSLIGFECLIRWFHPQLGFVSPTEFIPVAEETGLIIPIGLWVLQQACQQMRVWQEQFSFYPPLTINVNISVKQFVQPNLVEQIRQTLQKTGLPSQCLKLEITESVLMENRESATVLLSQLKALGVQLHMDDFGTGYSSLSYLHRFPLDTLKIDRSFVNGMGTNGEDSEIVKTIVTLAHNLGVTVTAEGVETTAQLMQLQAMQCDYAQGYYFSKPIDSNKATQLIHNISQGIYPWNLNLDYSLSTISEARELPGGDIRSYCHIALQTARKAAEHAVYQGEQQFRALFEKAAIGLALVDKYGRIIESNPALQQILGYSGKELCRKSVTEFTHPDDTDADMELYRTLATGKRDLYQIEKRYIHKDGHLIWGRLTVSLVRGGNNQPQFAIGMIEDITESKRTLEMLQKVHQELESTIAERTIALANASQQLQQESDERKRIEAALRESEERYQFLLETATEGIWIIDANNKTTLANKRIAEMLGYTIEEMLGLSLFTFMDETEVELANTYLQQRHQGLKEQHDFKFRRKDGSSFWAIINTNPIFSHTGRYIGALAMVMDITERKQNEQVLKLYQLLSKHTRDIVLFINLDEQIVEANEAAVNAYGYTYSELLSLKAKDIYAADYLDRQKLPPKNNYSALFETVHRRKDGTVFPIEMSIESALIGNEITFLCIIRDISDRKQVELSIWQQSEREKLVAKIAQRIRLSLDLEYILNTTVAEVRQFLQTQRVVIYRFDSNWRGNVVVESVADGYLSLVGINIQDDCFIETYIPLYKNGRVKAIDDINHADLHPCHVDLLTQLQVKANLVVPIIEGDKLWGLLIAHQCSSTRHWQKIEVELLKQLSTQVAIAIQQSELYQKLQAANQELQLLASSDGLTGVANRRHFDDYLYRKWQDTMVRRSCLSLILCDIDYFKFYNDTYGHQAGDSCLQQVAAAIGNVLRRGSDLVARYGGEEFAIILPDTSAQVALQIALRIRATVAALEISHHNSQISQYITLSLGVASTDDTSQFPPNTLIAIADKALYQAKAQGRDRVIFMPSLD